MSLAQSEKRRRETTQALDPAKQAEYAQFFTPAPVAAFMASLFELRSGSSRLLDPGAGSGQLTAAFAERWKAEATGNLKALLIERDGALSDPLRATLAQTEATGEVIETDYLDWSLMRRFEPDAAGFDYIIMNPPYAKLDAKSHQRATVSSLGVDVPNLYAAFVACALRQLAPNGQLVAITPRSFANGPYFQSFRKDLLDRSSVRQVHVYESRDSAFRDSAVLQENVVFHVEACSRGKSVLISSSLGSDHSAIRYRRVPMDEFVRRDDVNSFLHLSIDDEAAAKSQRVQQQPDTLASIGLAVSTGRVVDFRSKPSLRSQHTNGDAPLLYPAHMCGGTISWPRATKKPNALHVDETTSKLLLPAGCYVLIKRFSAKEERRRIVASLLTPEDLPGDVVAIENHLNIIHRANQGFDRELALGITSWLNCTLVDVAFRQFSGHTQVNATDLRSMRFPSEQTLRLIAQSLGGPVNEQVRIDTAVDEQLRLVP